MEFQYSGHDQNGKKVSGRRSATSEEELANALMRENILPIDITQASSKKNPAKGDKINLNISFGQRVKQIELQLFCRQLYTLLKAGLPITMSIQRLSETTNNQYFKQVLAEILITLNQGHSFVLALSKYPKVFSELFINIVRIGEDTGQLDHVFFKLSEYLGLEIEAKKKIKAALRYPIIVVITTLLALFIINIFVIPNFAKMFAQFKGELPLATRILIGTSDFLLKYWFVVIGAFILSYVAFFSYIQSPSGKIKWHHFILKIPITGVIVHRMYLARFCRLYALMLRSGLPALDSLIIVGKATGNAYLASKINEISDSVAKGRTISKACQQTAMFSNLVIQMLTLGEETGNMDDMLDDVAGYYEREVDYDLARLSDLIEPILLVIMAGMVLILAFGVFLPMWNMVDLTKR